MSQRTGPCHVAPTRPSAGDEFARGRDVWPDDPDGASRRSFLKRMAAALALAGMTGAGCSDRPQDEKLVAYTDVPDGLIPGRPLTYATTMPLSGYGRGVLAISREGRPIKIEGNPDHPSSLGGTDAFTQASILDLYDPGRSQSPTRNGSPVNWSTFDVELQKRLERHLANGGATLRVLSGTVTSPTLAAQIAAFEKRFPKAKWHVFEPLAATNSMAATTAAFGRPLNVVYDFTKAQTIVSLDCDFLFELPGSVRYARDFIAGRRVRQDNQQMNRLYVAESTFSLAGSMSDHRLPRRPSEIEPLARSLARACGVAGIDGTDDPTTASWVHAMADDLRQRHGQSLVIAGDTQPPAVHALAFAINQQLGNVGKSMSYVDALEVGAGDDSLSLAALVDELKSGRVETLLIFADNPAYSASADLDFATALAACSTARNADGSLRNFTVHLGQRANETAFRCQWHLPETHYLEQWGDLRGHDGTTSLVQPLILPMFSGRSTIELTDRLLGRLDRGGYEIVREHWRDKLGGDFENTWASALKRGVIESTTSKPIDVGAPKPDAFASRAPAAAAGIELVLRPDHAAWDGSFAANAWLQEVPRPLTKIVWENALLISPRTAARHGLHDDDIVRIESNGRVLDVPCMLLPGLPEDAVTLHLGYGQQTPVSDADESPPIGVNAFVFRDSRQPGYVSGVTLSATGRRAHVVRTHNHNAMDDVTAGPNSLLRPNAIVTSDDPEGERSSTNNRRLVRLATLDAFRAEPDIIRKLGGESEKKPLLSLYPEWDYLNGYQWGMSIDQTACIGCNACIVACQAENNIPVVGKEQVDREREMHWLRIDDYFGGDIDQPTVTHQPVPCMHCEIAPCEVVCPVAATTHSVEGLNQMIYNRCVGTRYCSNNCPYKVRRFNFLDYTSKLSTTPKKFQQNPEVTVRSRGVMEKCSYCVQRLQHTRIDAERITLELRERARLATDGSEQQRLLTEAKRREFEMVDGLDTACAQACPTRAITFGSIHPVAGQRTKLMGEKAQPHDYVLLRELTTKPRTSYLGRITNPNPAVALPSAGGQA